MSWLCRRHSLQQAARTVIACGLLALFFLWLAS